MPLGPGLKLGPYEVLAPLGAGGMGEVYRARDSTLGREVAIKVLPADLAKDTERLARFGREAKLLASLNHPNIAHVYGFEITKLDSGATVHFLAMELVEGEDLSERLERGAIPVDDALLVARQVAEALEEAHEHGIVHRDLKPANVKVTPDGKAKVLDFGLAKAMGDDAAVASGSGEVSHSPTMTRQGTIGGVILGTAAYMSPEQARGKAVDKRADIWAFGVLLYEMLTGQRQFEGETVSDVLAAVLTREPEWARLPHTTPPAIRDLLRRCLTRDVKKRQQGIGDARIALEEALAGPSAAQDAAVSRIRPAGRRAWTSAVMLATGALLSAAALWGLVLRRPQHEAMHFRAVTNFAGVQAQPALSPDGRSVAFVSNRDGDYDIYVGLLSGGQLIKITHDPYLESRPCFSPDGNSIAYARLNDWGLWDIWQVPALGGTPRRLILNAADPAWSRDGRSLAYSSDVTRAIWVSDPTGQSARQVTKVEPGLSGYDVTPRFSPDGRELAFVTRGGGPRGELSVVDLGSGKVRPLTHDLALAQSPAWSPDGRYLYFASSRGGAMNIWKVRAAGGEAQQITAGQGDDLQPDVSADGSRIVFATYRESLGFAQLDLSAPPASERPKQLSIDPARNQIGPAYSPDGARLAYFSNFKGVEKEGIWVAGADGSDPVPLAQDAAVNIFPKWTPDGEQLIYMSGSGSGSEYRRVSSSGGAPTTLLGDADDYNFDIGLDGRMLLRDAQGRVQSYDPSTRKLEELALSAQSRAGWLLRWSRDGQSTAYILSSREENDPLAGLWVEGAKTPPRQLFHGWVMWYARGPGNRFFLREGKADLNGFLWTVGWDGQGLTRLTAIPMVYSYWAASNGIAQNYIDVSPDGRRVVFGSLGVQQANIGMIENVR